MGASKSLNITCLLAAALACCQLANPGWTNPVTADSAETAQADDPAPSAASTSAPNKPTVETGVPAGVDKTDAIVAPEPVPAVRPAPDTASGHPSSESDADADVGASETSPAPSANAGSTKQADENKETGSFRVPRGRWTGTGKLVPTSGIPEDFKCVVTYIPAKGEEGKPDLTQNLRCKSRHYRLDATAEFVINDRELDGYWQDRANNVSGYVQGVITEKGYEILLKSEAFEAYMQVTGTDCTQSVTVVPMKITYVRELTASLRKC